MQNLDEIIRDPELYEELVKAYGMTIHSRMIAQFYIDIFKYCIFVSDSERSFIVDYSQCNPYILYEVE